MTLQGLKNNPMATTLKEELFSKMNDSGIIRSNKFLIWRVCERLHPILMLILIYNYKQLTECIKEVGQIEDKVNNKKRRGLTSVLKNLH